MQSSCDVEWSPDERRGRGQNRSFGAHDTFLTGTPSCLAAPVRCCRHTIPTNTPRTAPESPQSGFPALPGVMAAGNVYGDSGAARAQRAMSIARE